MRIFKLSNVLRVTQLRTAMDVTILKQLQKQNVISAMMGTITILMKTT
jgi:hypothetical protein